MRFDAITRNNDFRRAYGRGRSYVGYCLVAYIAKNRVGHTRVGITCSKKIGGAVQRNRARRVIRAALAAVLPYGGVGGYDIVLVARGCTAAQKSTQVAAVLRRLLTAAGLVPLAAPAKAAIKAAEASASAADANSPAGVPLDQPAQGAAGDAP